MPVAAARLSQAPNAAAERRARVAKRRGVMA